MVCESQNLIAAIQTSELKIPDVENFKTDRENLLWLKSKSATKRNNFIKKYQIIMMSRIKEKLDLYTLVSLLNSSK